MSRSTEQVPVTVADPVSIPTHVGPWRLEHTEAGTGLRRDPARSATLGSGLPDWAPVDVVAPQGRAERIVLLGESTARGWPLEDLLSPASVLQRHLDAVGEYQCVDLAKVGANGEDLSAVARCLPSLGPATIVSFAGNNWMLSPPAADDGTMDRDAGVDLPARLASSLHAAGYPGMRATFADVALRTVQDYIELLAAAALETGASVVIVIPEFDLQRFAPPLDVELPLLDRAATHRWYELRSRARQALAAGMPEPVGDLTEEMAALDRGCSPVPGWLAGMAAIALNDGATARVALEQSRDSVVGLMVRHTPRVTAAVREALIDAADRHGFRVVDMSEVLSDGALPDLPDPRFFLDYCHLSDAGIEQAMAAVADAVLDRPRGTAETGPGVPAQARAFADARVAAQLAFQGQPESVVTDRLAGAAAADDGIAAMLRQVRELLVSPEPGWASPAMGRLMEIELLRPFLPSLVGSAAQRPELWSLLRSLDAVLGDRVEPITCSEIDVLELQTTGSHLQANWRGPHAHLVSFCSVSPLHLGPLRIEASGQALMIMDYRTPVASPAATIEVRCEGWSSPELPASPSWRRCSLELPAHVLAAYNPILEVHWPTPHPDVDVAIGRDVAALDRGEFPTVFPVHGEIYSCILIPAADQPAAGG